MVEKPTVGDRVRVLPDLSSRYAGEVGTIRKVDHRGSISVALDGHAAPLPFGSDELEPRALTVERTTFLDPCAVDDPILARLRERYLASSSDPSAALEVISRQEPDLILTIRRTA